MGITLTGKTIKDTYEGLLKLANNTTLTTGVINVTDGFGNSSALFLSPTDVRGRAMYSNQTNSELDSAGNDALATKGWVGTQTAAATSFIALSDTPSSFGGNQNMNAKVNAAGTAIVFEADYYDFACSDETTDIASGTVFTMEFVRSYKNISGLEFTVTTAPTGSNLIINVKKNGTSIYSGNYANIDAGTTSTLSSIISNPLTGLNFDMAAGDVLTIVVDQVGSTVSGNGLKAFMTYNNIIV